MSTIIQRSMSERSREKCLRLHIGGGHPIVECSHRVARRMCRHTGSKLRHQARLEYVQSTPNVATMHNGKHAAANPRGGTGDVNGSVIINIRNIPKIDCGNSSISFSHSSYLRLEGLQEYRGNILLLVIASVFFYWLSQNSISSLDLGIFICRWFRGERLEDVQCRIGR